MSLKINLKALTGDSSMQVVNSRNVVIMIVAIAMESSDDKMGLRGAAIRVATTDELTRIVRSNQPVVRRRIEKVAIPKVTTDGHIAQENGA
jgi:hypothetical protein